MLSLSWQISYYISSIYSIYKRFMDMYLDKSSMFTKSKHTGYIKNKSTICSYSWKYRYKMSITHISCICFWLCLDTCQISLFDIKKYIEVIFNFIMMKNITGLYVYKNIKIHSIQRSTFFTCIHISHILRCNLFCKFIVNKIFISYIFFHMYKYFNQKRISFHLQFIQCSVYFFTQI